MAFEVLNDVQDEPPTLEPQQAAYAQVLPKYATEKMLRQAGLDEATLPGS